jgi:hypothetical protein
MKSRVVSPKISALRTWFAGRPITPQLLFWGVAGGCTLPTLIEDTQTGHPFAGASLLCFFMLWGLGVVKAWWAVAAGLAVAASLSSFSVTTAAGRWMLLVATLSTVAAAAALILSKAVGLLCRTDSKGGPIITRHGAFRFALGCAAILAIDALVGVVAGVAAWAWASAFIVLTVSTLFAMLAVEVRRAEHR